MEISFTPDSDGYLSQECPECKKLFKVQFTQDDNGKPLRYCCYCGHSGEGCWWTQAQVDYITASLAHTEIIPRLKEMGQHLERSTRGGFVQFKTRISNKPVPPRPMESNDPWPLKTLSCCAETVKHAPNHSIAFCPICGCKPVE